VRVNRAQLLMAILFVFLTHTVFAKKECDEADWSCHDNYAFTAGYIYVHEYYPTQGKTLAIPGHPNFEYNIKRDLPNDYSGIRLGFGSSLGHSRSFGFQLYYNHIFPKSNTYNNLQFTGEYKVFLGAIEYILNPKSRTKVALVAGAAITSSYLSIKSLDPNIAFSLKTNTVDIDPILGANIAYQINSRFEVKFIYFYDFATFNPNLYGRSVPALVLSYYPPL